MPSGGPRPNSGGPRKGAGRPPRAVEDNVKQHIKAALEAQKGGSDKALKDIWNKIIEKAKLGSVHHTTIFFNYYYGKPKDNLDQPQQMTIRVVRE